MQSEVREGKMLAEKMGIGNWIIQLDADEYFIRASNVKELYTNFQSQKENGFKSRFFILKKNFGQFMKHMFR